MTFAAGDFFTADDANRLPPVKGVRITSAGNPIAATSGTTELDMSKYGLSALTLTTGRYYLYRAMFTFTKTVATDGFDFRLRVNTAVSGTQVAKAPVDPTDGLTVGYRYVDMLFLGDAAYTSLHLSVVRAAGTGTLSYFGTSGGFNRGWAMLLELGDNWSDAA